MILLKKEKINMLLANVGKKILLKMLKDLEEKNNYIQKIGKQFKRFYINFEKSSNKS